MIVLREKLRKAVLLAVQHDVFNTAKAAAYSGILMLFPMLVVATTVLTMVPEGPSMMGELRGNFLNFLPGDSLSLLHSSQTVRHLRSARVLFSAAGLSLFAGIGVMNSLMEGFRRAYRLPQRQWGTIWHQQFRALLLVLIVVVPLALASMMLVFGRVIESWMIELANHEMRYVVLFFWRLVRWAVTLVTGIAVLGALYHFGTKRTEHWVRVMPGAIAATLAWFPTTLAFGWYVTRVANYSRYYGSFSAGIATLVWLYITAFSALLGAELNGVLFRSRERSYSSEDGDVRIPSQP
jgi:membrane protein